MERIDQPPPAGRRGRSGYAGRFGLRERALAMAAIGAVLLVVVAAFELRQVADVRSANRSERHSAEVIQQGERVLSLVVDTETGLRGYQLTRAQQFLAPYRTASVAMPAATARLAALAADNPGQRRRAATIAATIGAYLRGYAPRVLRTPSAGAALVLEGKRRVDALRAGLATFLSEERRLQETRRAHATAVTGRLSATLVARGLLLLALLAGLLLYLDRRIVRPVLALRSAADQMATGSDELPAPIEGPAEIGALALSFDDMARSLLSQRAELAGYARSQAAMLDGVFERSPLALGFVDREQRFLRVNAALAAMNGVPAADHVGRTIAEVVPDVDAAARTLMQSVIDSGRAVHEFEVRGATPAAPGLERWFRATYFPVEDEAGAVAVVGIVAEDVTVERREREHEAARIQDERRAALVTAVLEDLNRDLAARSGLAETAAALLHHALTAGDADEGMVALFDERRRELRTWACARGGTDVAPAFAVEPPAELVAAASGAETVAPAPERGGARVAAIPLRGSPGALGALSLRWVGPAEPGPDTLELLEQMAERAAPVIARAAAYEREHLIARTLQQSLLPGRLPALSGLEFAARFRPAGDGTLVGGDVYDVIETGGGSCIAWVGDVCGKGPQAAALAGLARQTMRAESRHTTSPAALLDVLNRVILDRDAETFLTAAVLLIEPADGRRARVTSSVAGHPPPIWAHADGSFTTLPATSPLIGVWEVPFREQVVEALPGDRLVLYTDGLTEAYAPEAQLEAGALIDAMRADAPSLDGALDALIGLTDRHGRVAPRDDIALLGIRFGA